MKVGVTAPQFTTPIDDLDHFAKRAQHIGLDGIFCFDHLWPTDRPGGPALSGLAILGYLARVTSDIYLGTLVSRIGLLPDEVLVAELVNLANLAPARVLCGLGLGDRASEPERVHLGLDWFPLADRLASLETCARRLIDHDIEVWIGGSSRSVRDISRRLGCSLNLWSPSLDELDTQNSGQDLTWAGPISGPGKSDAHHCARELVDLANRGFSWAVWAWPSSLELVDQTLKLARHAIY